MWILVIDISKIVGIINSMLKKFNKKKQNACVLQLVCNELQSLLHIVHMVRAIN